jgi:concanavalin A-like lectin/glucanase superfamily protein
VWYSVTAVKTTKEISIYLNGVLEDTTALGTYSNSDTADFLVGADKAEGAFLNGLISHVILFRKALNSGQIRALYERTNLAHEEF